MKHARNAELEFIADRIRQAPPRRAKEPPLRLPVGEATELDLTEAEREAMFTPTRPADLTDL